MINISLKVSGLENINTAFSEAESRAGSMEWISEQLAQAVRDDVNTRFLTSPATLTGGVAYGNIEYAKLSNYALSRNPQRAEGQIHIDTGKLWKGAVTPGADNLFYTDGDTFFFQLTGENVAELQNLRPIVFWHQVLLDQLSQIYTDNLLANDSSNSFS